MATNDDIRREINEAIGAHGAWKLKLTTAARQGGLGLDPAVICRDDQCAFGRWIRGIPATAPGAAHRKKAMELHAAFHREAGQVARQILSGNTAAAQGAMERGGFATSSNSLRQALNDWKAALN